MIALLFASVSLAVPIVNGEVEEGYPSVLGLGILWGDSPMVMCTGNLITPRVVLSAAHCSADFPIETVVTVGRAFFGTDLAEPEATFELEAGAVHPDYVELNGFNVGEYDLALLALVEDAPYTPTRVNLDPRDDSAVGTVIKAVGYGVTDPNASTNGVKHSTDLVVTTVTDMHLKGTVDTDAGDGNICSGDSGGPSFATVDGEPIQWAVHSYGDQGCSTQWGSTRPDVAADWILDFVEEVHGTDDLCEVQGRYDDGRCDAWCDATDPDCEPDIEDDEERRRLACATGPAGPWWLGLFLSLLRIGAARRRP